MDYSREYIKTLGERVRKWEKYATTQGLNPYAESSLARIDPKARSIYVGPDEIANYYYYNDLNNYSGTDSGRQETLSNHGSPVGFLSLPLIMLLGKKAKLLEEDKEYLKIEERLKKEWLKNNNKKDFTNEEGLAYLYGNPERLNAPNLRREAEKWFSEGLDIENEIKRKKAIEKRRKKLEKYEKEKKKIYKNPDNDPAVINVNQKILLHAAIRFAFLKAKNKGKKKEIKFEKVLNDVKKGEWRHFVKKYKEKAKEYSKDKYKRANCHAAIRQALSKQGDQRSEHADADLYDKKTPVEKTLEQDFQKPPQEPEKEEKKEQEQSQTQQISERQVRESAQEKTPPSEPSTQSTKVEVQRSVRSPAENKPFNLNNFLKRFRGRQTSTKFSTKAVDFVNRFSRGRSPFGNTGSMVRNLGGRGGGMPRQLGQRAFGKLGGRIGGTILKQAGSAAVKAILMNPYVLGAIGIIILIIVVILIIINMGEPGKKSGEDIASCQFYRSDQNPQSAKYKSNVLMGYIQEASSLTKIPAVVLAGFIRVESPSSVNYSDEDIKNYQCTPDKVSATGALGIMQIQPQGTKGHDGPAVQNGARLLGLDYNSLTRDDYCDVRKNIIIGAGFILKKMSYLKYGDGTKWESGWTNQKDAIDALAESYYGCVKYPVCENRDGSGGGPHSYGDDVWKSIKTCQQQQQPIPPGTGGGVGNERIVQNASQITQNLRTSYDSDLKVNLYNVKVDEPGVYYWCTYLIVDSYNKAGVLDLNRVDHGGVINMKNFFARSGRFKFLPPETPAEQLKPGDVIFFEGIGQHVSLIKSIEMDPAGTGRGVIHTYESNNVQLEDNVNVENHRATKAQTTSRRYSITGFGRVN